MDLRDYGRVCMCLATPPQTIQFRTITAIIVVERERVKESEQEKYFNFPMPKPVAWSLNGRAKSNAGHRIVFEGHHEKKL